MLVYRLEDYPHHTATKPSPLHCMQELHSNWRSHPKFDDVDATQDSFVVYLRGDYRTYCLTEIHYRREPRGILDLVGNLDKSIFHWQLDPKSPLLALEALRFADMPHMSKTGEIIFNSSPTSLYGVLIDKDTFVTEDLESFLILKKQADTINQALHELRNLRSLALRCRNARKAEDKKAEDKAIESTEPDAATDFYVEGEPAEQSSSEVCDAAPQTASEAPPEQNTANPPNIHASLLELASAASMELQRITDGKPADRYVMAALASRLHAGLHTPPTGDAETTEATLIQNHLACLAKSHPTLPTATQLIRDLWSPCPNYLSALQILCTELATSARSLGYLDGPLDAPPSW